MIISGTPDESPVGQVASGERQVGFGMAEAKHVAFSKFILDRYRRILGAGLLLPLLVLACCPAGLDPKKLGPYGRALCACEWSNPSSAEKAACSQCRIPASDSPCVFSWQHAPEAISEGDGAGLVLSPALDIALDQPSFALQSKLPQAAGLRPADPQLPAAQCLPEIPTPPPKA